MPNDVEVFTHVNGEEIERFIARHRDVQEALETEARGAAAIAEGVLASHHHSGDSYIEVEHGDIDWYVTLNDTRGQAAAAAIEFGRHEAGNTSEPVGALHAAFRLGDL